MSNQSESYEQVIRVQSENLSDGSSVFSVVLVSGEGFVKFECLDLWHADNLAQLLKSSINGYSMGKANIVHRI